jgi:hypothetical protein
VKLLILLRKKYSLIKVENIYIDDPELYKTKIKFIEDNRIEDMELTFIEEEYSDGQLVRVIIS